MQQENKQKADLDRHDQRIGDERVRVLVERVLPEKDQRVSGQVKDEIREERQPCQPDQQLCADR